MLNKKAAAAAVSALVSSSALQNPLFFLLLRRVILLQSILVNFPTGNTYAPSNLLFHSARKQGHTQFYGTPPR